MKNRDDSALGITASWERRDLASGQPVAAEIVFRADETAVRPQPERRPLSVGLCIDRSGSMSGDKLEAAKRAAIGVVEGLRDGERLAVVAFDTDVIDISSSVVLSDQSRSRLRNAISRIEAGSSTALFDGFLRTAELVAEASHPSECDSWVIVLSDGMGNTGLTDPQTMRKHAAALADRGIRTISVGIGNDYEAAQLTALSDGGSGEFHHASKPGEIVEIALGALRALRDIAARDVKIGVLTLDARRLLLLGGDASQSGFAGVSRFARVTGGRSVRAVALLWPKATKGLPRLDVAVSWLDRDMQTNETKFEMSREDATEGRDILLAVRAARLWHAQIMARSLELNEGGSFKEAESYARSSLSEFIQYAEGLPEMEELVESLHALCDRIGRMWRTTAHRELYKMSRDVLAEAAELREDAPMSFPSAMRMDDEA